MDTYVYRDGTDHVEQHWSGISDLTEENSTFAVHVIGSEARPEGYTKEELETIKEQFLSDTEKMYAEKSYYNQYARSIKKIKIGGVTGFYTTEDGRMPDPPIPVQVIQKDPWYVVNGENILEEIGETFCMIMLPALLGLFIETSCLKRFDWMW